MTSLQGLLPPPGSSNWRKSVRVYTDGDDEANVVRHVVIREVWVEKRPWPHAVSCCPMGPYNAGPFNAGLNAGFILCGI